MRNLENLNLSSEQREAIEKATKDRQEAIAKATTDAIVNAEIRKATDATSIKLELVSQDLDKIAIIQGATDQMEMTERPYYGGGAQVDAIVTLARTILYSKKADKETICSETGLKTNVLELVSESVGNAPYYSPSTGEIVDGVYPDLPMLKAGCQSIADTLGLVAEINFDKYSDENISKTFKAEKLKAERLKRDTEEALKEEQTYEV